jgi:hypothetical protein
MNRRASVGEIRGLPDERRPPMAITHLTHRPAVDPTARSSRQRTLALLLLTAFGLAAVGYGVVGTALDVGAPPPPTDSAGRVEGSPALVTVLTRGDEVIASVCDGGTGFGERFAGTMVGGRAVVHSADGAELFVDVADTGATGTFTPAGAPAGLPFRTAPATGTVQGCTASG